MAIEVYSVVDGDTSSSSYIELYADCEKIETAQFLAWSITEHPDLRPVHIRKCIVFREEVPYLF